MGTSVKEWRPDETLDGLDANFGASNVMRLMPPMSDIPADFKKSSNKWVRFQADWFFKGIANLECQCKEGIDRMQALRHLAAINRSFEPQHEHKEAAVAYLASLWFDDVSYTVAK